MQKEKVHMKTTQENAGKKYELLCYTRKPEEDSIYSEKLAYSMHLLHCVRTEEALSR